MSKSCATLIELLRFAPEFGTVGTKSYGTITLAVQPNPGDVLSIVDSVSIPPVKLELVAGTDFDIGLDTTETAVNVAAALTGLVVGTSDDNVITVVSVASGAATLYSWSSDFGELEPADALGTEPALGPVPVALVSACAMVGACYGNKTSTATLYLAAHLLATQTGKGAGGSVNKRKIKDLETQYNVTGVPSDNDLGATKYGRLFLQIKKTVFIGPVVGRSGSGRFGCAC